MIIRLFKSRSAKFRIALGLSGILVSLFLVAAILGLVPDRNSAIRDGHAALAEAIAVNSSIFITRSDLIRMQANLEVVVQRNEDILSAAVRRTDGKAVVVIGDHQSAWRPLEQGISADGQVVVPIFEGGEQWGQVELRFTPLIPAGWLGKVYHPLIWMISFMSISSFVIFFFYLGKMLKHLDPSQAIPDRVRSALDTMAEGLLVLDAKQNVVLANQAFATLVDKPAASLLGYQVSRFPWVTTEGHQLEPGDSPWSRTLVDGEARTSAIVRLQLSGSSRTFMVNCSPVLSGAGKTAGVLISFDDVTELEEKELELRLSKEEAEAANRSKSEFLANMSHEIRTPMNAILGFAEVLKRGYSKNSQDSLKYLNTISSSGNHLLGLINDILDLSKVEAGRIEVEKIRAPVHHIIHEVVQIMRIKAEEKGIYLEYRPDGPLPEQIDTDPAKVRQIITNLVGNAIKFTETGGVTIVSRFTDQGAASTLALDVVDTGIGMSSEQAAAVFNPFTQADSSITRRFGGTGLGLTISQRFAEALGGGIEVSSREGEGSTFSATLAIGAIAGSRLLSVEEILCGQELETQAEHRRWEFPPARVLVVDDGAENRHLLEVVLEDLGLQVSSAENGQLGLDLVTSQTFDLVLMDVQMPVMDGYTAVGLMREKGYQLPVIALTAHAMKGAEQACLKAGYSGYMTKPINIDQLTERLARELGGRALSEAQWAESHSEPQAALPSTNLSESLSEAGLETGVGSSVAANADPEEEKITSSLPLSNAKFRTIVERFVARLEEQLEAIDSAWQARNYLEIANLGHWLKGSAGSVGFNQFTELAQELELAAREQNDKKIEASLAAIQRLFARIDVSSASGSAPQVEPDSEHDQAVGKHYDLPEALTSRLPDTHPKFRPIIEKFVVRIAEQLEVLESAIAEEDYPAIGKLAHWLKGSGGSVGFDAFTEPAADLEIHARDGDLASIRQVAVVISELNRRITLTQLEVTADSGYQNG